MDEGYEEEPEVYDPNLDPVPRKQLQGPTPRWAETLNLWGQEQGQQPLSGMCMEFHDIYEGSPANRSLPVIAGRISHQADQLNQDHDQARHNTKAL
ncbi:unnamed protein product [Lactuca saligna]|uniref:Uncharacterized protein n=1 Tax=Lactuca saligna TaxID=75948 RepID=A0AA35VCS2_LACSI|nr:unnamed protein product [Lactuca saligna]